MKNKNTEFRWCSYEWQCPFPPHLLGWSYLWLAAWRTAVTFFFLRPDHVQILPIFIAAASTVSQTSSLASSSQPWPGDGTATAAGARGAAEGARGGGGLTRVRCLCRAGEGSCHQTWVKIGGNASSNTFPEAWGGAAEEEEVPRPVSPPAAGLRQRGSRRFSFGFTAGPGQDEPARSPGRRREPWQVPEAGAGGGRAGPWGEDRPPAVHRGRAGARPEVPGNGGCAAVRPGESPGLPAGRFPPPELPHRGSDPGLRGGKRGLLPSPLVRNGGELKVTARGTKAANRGRLSLGPWAEEINKYRALGQQRSAAACCPGPPGS